ALATAIAVLVAWCRARSWTPDFREIARQIETQHPDLHALLLTAVEQTPDPQTGQLHFLQERVIEEAIAESERQHWVDTVSDCQLAWAQLASLGTFLILVLLTLQLGVSARGGKNALLGGAKGISVSPGDVGLERGSGLVVLARFAKAPSGDVTLVI